MEWAGLTGPMRLIRGAFGRKGGQKSEGEKQQIAHSPRRIPADANPQYRGVSDRARKPGGGALYRQERKSISRERAASGRARCNPGAKTAVGRVSRARGKSGSRRTQGAAAAPPLALVPRCPHSCAAALPATVQ